MRPSFCVATAYLDRDDRTAAVDVGMRLYDCLTRDRNDPLAFGPGIPVYVGIGIAGMDAERLAELAERVLLVVVASGTPLLRRLDDSVEDLNRFAERLGRDYVVLLTSDGRWRAAAALLYGLRLIRCRRNDPVAAVDEVLLSIQRVLANARSRPTLVISHSPMEEATGASEANPQVETVFSAARTHPLFRTFFADVFETLGSDQRASDAAPSGTKASEAERHTDGNGSGSDQILIAVRSDDFTLRPDCQRDLITAKRLNLPIVVVDTCVRGERRSSPYAGNAPTVMWRDNPDEILRLAVVEYLRRLHFDQIAHRVLENARLPTDTLPLGRPPELLDTAGGVLSRSGTRTILHPDPQLPVAERELLREASPRLRLFTPSTAFRRLLGRESDIGSESSGDNRLAPIESPLDGIRVGLSASDVTEASDLRGTTRYHREDIAVQLVRGLVGSGASIAYGGDLRFDHQTPFTPLLAETIVAYNQTAGRPADHLHVYQSAYADLSAAPSNLLCRIHHLSESDDMRRLAALPPPDDGATIPQPMHDMDMRQVMTSQVDARVAVGGNTMPRSGDGGGPEGMNGGYGGRFPGVVEEIFRAMRAGQPVYICGGAGGAAGLVAQLLENSKHIPAPLTESFHRTNRRFISVCWDIDRHPLRKHLKIPDGLDAMAKAIGEFAEDVTRSDKASLDWNGLSVEQNRALWHSQDPLVIGSLVLEGLIRWRQRRTRASRKQRIEVLRGDLTSIDRADLIAVPIFDDVEPQGAAAAIDQATGGLVRQMQGQPRGLIGLQLPGLDASFLLVVSLGSISKSPNNAEIAEGVRRASGRVADECLRHGFRSAAVVTFGGATIEYPQAVMAMLDGFRTLDSSVTLKWAERNDQKFQTLVRQLNETGNIAVTTLTRPVPSSAPIRERWLQLNILRTNEGLAVRVLSPSNTSVALMFEVPLTNDELEALSAGSRSTANATPSASELIDRGRRLTGLLFAEESERRALEASGYRFEVTHDAASSRLPFELLCFGETEYRPALASGLHRRLEIRAASPTASLKAQSTANDGVRIGLVVNPTQDLPGSVKEADRLSELLQPHRGDVEVRRLEGDQVDRKSFEQFLQWADVLHYCGHAFFEGPGLDESGLLLADHVKFTASDLSNVDHLPRIVFFNACQAARVRKSVVQDNNAFALAELILRTGVEAFIGTYWEVRDDAAAEFAATVYQRLAERKSLSEAVTSGRQSLQQNHRSDWANYLLYGDGRFRFA